MGIDKRLLTIYIKLMRETPQQLAHRLVNLALDGRNRLIWHFTTSGVPLSEIARVLGITRERVRQIRNKYAKYVELEYESKN